MYWLSTTTPTSGLSMRSCAASRMPSSVWVGGILMSVTTTSGCTRSTRSSTEGQIRRGTDQLQALGPGHQLRQPLPEQRDIVSQHHPDRHATTVWDTS